MSLVVEALPSLGKRLTVKAVRGGILTHRQFMDRSPSVEGNHECMVILARQRRFKSYLIRQFMKSIRLFFKPLGDIKVVGGIILLSLLVGTILAFIS